MNVGEGSKPPITVLMTARDEERTIRRALRSVQLQTFADFKVVVVDDGSSDATADIAGSFAARDPRFSVVSNAHPAGPGVAAASNFGLDHCDTEFVARLDADDMMMPRRLEHQIAELRSNARAVAVGTYGVRVTDRLLPLGMLRVGPAGRDAFLRTSAHSGYVNVTHSSIMYRRDAVEAAGRYPLDYTVAEDLAMYSRLIELGEIYAIPRALTIVVIRASSLSSRHLYEEELGMRRIRAESRLGRRFTSFEAFLAHAASDPALKASVDDIDRVVARRMFGRSLASGRLRQALGVLRSSGMARELLRATVHRVFTGR